jgi:hypothetical protein
MLTSAVRAFLDPGSAIRLFPPLIVSWASGDHAVSWKEAGRLLQQTFETDDKKQISAYKLCIPAKRNETLLSEMSQAETIRAAPARFSKGGQNGAASITHGMHCPCSPSLF